MNHAIFSLFLERINKEKISPELVPEKVIQAFQTKYPDASVYGWVKLHLNRYGVCFYEKVWHKYAKFSIEGDWLESTVFSVSKTLPAEVKATVSKHFKGKTIILEVETTIKNTKEFIYDILVQYRSEEHRLLINKDGNLIEDMNWVDNIKEKEAEIPEEDELIDLLEDLEDENDLDLETDMEDAKKDDLDNFSEDPVDFDANNN